MKERKITINGTSQQVKITAEQAAIYNFIAADSDGEVWLYERKPSPDSFEGLSFDPGHDNDFMDHDDCLNMDGVDWMSTITPINIVLDPDALADMVEVVIRAKYSQTTEHLDSLINDVKNMIKAGN